MKHKKQLRDGAVEKEFNLVLEYTHRFKTGEAVVKHEAKLSTYDMTISHMMNFQKDVGKIFGQMKRICTMNPNDHLKLMFSVSAYERVPEYRDENGVLSTLKQLLFDYWEYVGDGTLITSEEGLYLTPDERYTEAERAIWISINKEEGGFLEQLAEHSWVCDTMAFCF